MNNPLIASAADRRLLPEGRLAGRVHDRHRVRRDRRGSGLLRSAQDEGAGQAHHDGVAQAGVFGLSDSGLHGDHLFTGRGSILLELGRLPEAEPLLTRSLVLDPSLYLASWALGTFYFMIGRGGRALPHLEQALRLAPPAMAASSRSRKPCRCNTSDAA